MKRKTKSMSDEAETIVEKEVQKGENVLLTIRVKRDNSGITLFLQSKVFEDFFRHSAVMDDYCGIPFYRHPTRTRLSEYSVNNLNGSLFLDGHPNNTNISWLRAKGITEGVSIPISQVASTDAIADYVKGFQQAAAFIYKQYIKPVDVSVEIIFRETKS